jgi:hypothetical protein
MPIRHPILVYSFNILAHPCDNRPLQFFLSIHSKYYIKNIASMAISSIYPIHPTR